MRKVLALLVAVFLAVTVFADGGKYKINDQDVDQMFSSATELVVSDAGDLMNLTSIPEINGEKNPWIAWILCGTYFGHRIYLGTKTGVIIGYILTCGGCGILTSVDAIVLLIGAINDDISKYVDNSKFIMWL